jgi:hypothetical protein
MQDFSARFVCDHLWDSPNASALHRLSTSFSPVLITPCSKFSAESLVPLCTSIAICVDCVHTFRRESTSADHNLHQTTSLQHLIRVWGTQIQIPTSGPAEPLDQETETSVHTNIIRRPFPKYIYQSGSDTQSRGSKFQVAQLTNHISIRLSFARSR